jgi:hypothetical protein
MKVQLWHLLENPKHHRSDGDRVLDKYLIKDGKFNMWAQLE